jgi:hypothetical protein
MSIQALTTEPPSQKWYDGAKDKPRTRDVEYLDVLKEIPEKSS